MSAAQVSVVIPVYRRQQSGAAAIRSALAQDGVAVEVIVVDDASPTPFQLPEDLRALPEVRLIRREKNGGPAAARNTGISAASGEWIAFLDSDDQFLPGKLARQIALADPSRPRRTIACGFAYERRGAGKIRGMIPIVSSGIEDFCSGCWHCPGSTALIHRGAFDIVGPLDEGLRRLEDLDWFVRLAMRGGSMAVMPELGAWIDVGANGSVIDVDRAAARIAKKFGAPRRGLPEPAWRKLAAYLALERAAARWKNGRRFAAMPYLLQSYRHAPRHRGLHLRAWWTHVESGGATGSHKEVPSSLRRLPAQSRIGAR